MIKRLTIRNYRLTLTFARIGKMIGVNSIVDDEFHILMWDFDEVPLEEVKAALKVVQTRYLLSTIHILRTKEPNNYIAYCFTALHWKTVVEIIAQTHGVDWQFFRFGVYRGHFTLRVTPKGERTPKLVARLEGLTPADCSPEHLESWVRYETLSWR